MPRLSCFSLAFKHVPRLLPALISHSPGASRVAASQRQDQVCLHQWCKAWLCQVWMGLVHHPPPQKFALGLFAKVGLKPLFIWWQLPCPLPLFPGQVKGLWRTCGCAGLAPPHLSLLFASSARCFKLSTQREDLCHTGGLSQWSHLCSPLFSTFSFFPPIFRDSAMNKKRHLIEGFI